MANLTFTSASWGNASIITPNRLAADVLSSFKNSIIYLDDLEPVSEDLSSSGYRAQFDNDGVLTAAGSGFDTDYWRIQSLTYAEPADRVAFDFSGNLQLDAASGNFGGSIASIRAKLSGLEVAAAGTWNINSAGNGTGLLREATYKQSGVTLRIEDSSISYDGYRASGTLGKVTVISSQGDSLSIANSSKLTAPFLNNLQGLSWNYFFSADFLNGSDRMIAGERNDDFAGFAGDDRLFGRGGNDTLTGGTGNDSLYGENGRDSLRGGSESDVLDGGPGDDTMTGGPGSDLYYVDSIADRVIETDSSLGSGGTDSVYSRLPAYTLPANVENLRLLSTGAANAAGNGRSNILFAGAGDNVLDGGAGSDTLSYIYAQSGVTVSLADATSQATGGSGSDRLIGIENLTGSAFNDSLTGNGVDNVLRGKGGNDRLAGGGGNDLLDGGAGVDTLLGGGGNDVFVVDSLGDVVWESQLPGGGIDTLQFEFGGASAVTVSLGGIASDLAAGKTYSNVENLTLGGAAAHNAVGSVANNQIVGNAAANKLFGQNGNDTLVGGAGADTLAGGDGNDRFVLSSATVADTVSDFTTAIDKMAISQAGIRVGDGNTLLTSSTLGGPGGFSNTIELVVVTGNIDGAITATSAAAKIGPAVAAYTVGRKALFAVDNGADSALYLFTAANADAGVSAGELKLLAMMTDTASTAVSDYLFVA